MDNQITEKEALKKAIKLVGGQTELAKKLTELLNLEKPLKQAHIWNWLEREGRVPTDYAPAVESIVNGQVTRRQLRQGVYWGPVEAS